MDKMKLYLIRHAESIANEKNIADGQLDFELSKKGQERAKKYIKILNKNKYDVFIVSPLKRTIQTILPFLNTLKNPKVLVNELTIERNLGKFQGSKLGAFQKYCAENNLDRVTTRPKGGESIMDVKNRAKKLVDYLRQNFKNESILICGHKNFLLCLEIILTGKSIKDFYSYKPMENEEIRVFEL